MTTKEEARRMDRLAQLGCLVCHNKGYENTPTEIDHIIDIKNKDRNHMRTIPLCPIHHRTGLLHRNPKGLTGWDRWREIGYHQAPKQFALRYGSKRELFEQVEQLLSS